MCEWKNSFNVTTKKKFDGNLFIKCAGIDCPTVMEGGQERTSCLRSTCITVTCSLLISAGNFHVSVLRFNNWADTRKPWDFSRCYWQGQRSTIPFHHHLCSECSLSLRCVSDLCQPPTPPGSILHTHSNRETNRRRQDTQFWKWAWRWDPQPQTIHSLWSQVTITNQAQEWNNILSSSSCLQRQEFRALFPWQQKRASQQPPR